jgi:hypothetical protein
VPVEMNAGKIRERIGLLLKKAESTTPEEAEALTAQAARLAARHGVDAAAVLAEAKREGRSVLDEPIIVRRITFRGAYREAHLLLVHSVAQAMGLQTVRTAYGAAKVHQLAVVGHESDVDLAEDIGHSLIEQGERAYKVWRKGGDWEAQSLILFGTAWEKYKAKRAFLVNFGAGAGERIKANRLTVEAEVAGTSTELVLIDRSLAVKQAVGEHFPKTRKSRGIDASGVAGMRGREAGRNADTGDTRIGGGARAIGR